MFSLKVSSNNDESVKMNIDIDNIIKYSVELDIKYNKNTNNVSMYLCDLVTNEQILISDIYDSFLLNDFIEDLQVNRNDIHEHHINKYKKIVDIDDMDIDDIEIEPYSDICFRIEPKFDNTIWLFQMHIIHNYKTTIIQFDINSEEYSEFIDILQDMLRNIEDL